MRRALIGIFVIGFFVTVYPQKPPIKFGEVPEEALTMKSYPADSTAEAVVLADYGTSVISYSPQVGFELFFERTRRIKVLTEAGKKWADFSIQLYRDNAMSEKVVSIKGVTMNLENGEAVETKLKNDAVFREKYSKNIELVKTTLPNVKVGSVIDITYKIRSDFLFNFQDWEFQTTIPTVWSEYRAAIPEYFTYEKYMQGYVALVVNDHSVEGKTIVLGASASNSRVTYREDNYRWVASNVVAFHDEPFMTCRNDFISRMNFELATIIIPGEPIKHLTGSWKQINELFAESASFLGEVTGNGFLRKITDELTSSATTNAQKVDILHAYVSQNIAWNGEYGRFPDKSLKQVLENKKGNAAEINLLLASLIEKAGIPVSPVLLSTRDHGFLREQSPASTQFNYVICLARFENSQVLLDATDPYLPAGILPTRCLNGRGMAVAKGNFEWIPLEVSGKTRAVTNSELQLSPDGVLMGTLKMDCAGYRAQEKRKKYFSKGAEGYVSDFVGTRAWHLSNSEFTNAKEVREVFKEKHDITINEHVTTAGDVMYLSPFIHGQWTSNPFRSETRAYPVDFGNPFDEVYQLKMKLPDGYVVDELPVSKAIALPGNAARYTLSVAVAGDVINITSMLSVNKILFSSAEYPGLREFYNQVVAKQTEQIVLKKK